jgi:septal ring factor EnvC (AmiA/AmiB activator)
MNEENAMMSTNRNTLLGFSLALLFIAAGCASEPKKVSGLEQVQQNRAKLDDTREKLKRASSDLEKIQSMISDLQEKFSKTEDIATREKAKTALDRLSLKVQESELDFRELMAQNRSLTNELDRQLRSVAESNLNLMNNEKKAALPSDKDTLNQ